ncbi:Sel1-like repeat family protein [Skeletonema marinoi]|uniref:Sel1-like repeat family protein n=1 Tax=Skeletonema marinoi TaxID=267567 RepID=A0AAD8YL85_9STRA|nr:Sel1-like repeat family protein [Skeletonema marinoi]
MSTTDNNIDTEAADEKCCASCGIAEVDDIKLKNCDACDLVRYCSDSCQEDHRPNHEAICKKRAAELRDELLFEQPESSYLGDCPICCLPLSLDSKKSVSYFCCSKLVCKGCTTAHMMRQLDEKRIPKCPFCRHLCGESKENSERRRKERFEANDPFALREVGRKHFGDRDYDRAFEYLAKAADLGDVAAQFFLSLMYRGGLGVEKDEKMELYYLEEAAIGGDPIARCSLACHEGMNGRLDRAVKHWIIAAKLGHGDSVQKLKEMYQSGYVSKEDFASALRGHQAAVDATKSAQRDLAEKRLPPRKVDDIKLKNCDDCDLVRYCSDKCQEDHRPNHEAICKERAAELRDELLFRQPESSHFGDCPICCLPLSLDERKSVSYFCCSKVICGGCMCANMMRECSEKLNPSCPFCRQLYSKSKEESDRRKKKRCEANDPFALREVGRKHFRDGDYERAFEHFTKAAKLGDAEAQSFLSLLYREGLGVEKDEKMELYYLEEAAISGDPSTRYSLACHEGMNGRLDRAVKHFIIAAKLGHDDSIQSLKEMYKSGDVIKEDFASALRGHQAAVDATKSPQREAAEKFMTPS